VNILSVDFGTSSLKMAVLDENLNILRDTKVEYAYEVINKTHIQIDAEIVYAAFLKGLDNLQEYKSKIDVVAACNFSPTLVAMDKDGKPLYPMIIHLDRRSYPQSEFAIKAVGKEAFLNINGNLPFPGGISCTSILWIKDNLPEIYKQTYKFGHFNTYFHRRLVGKWATDPTNASFTGIYETFKGGSWSEELCKGLGIDMDKLPDIVPSLSIIGHLTREAAAETGLREGIPVLMGSNDTSSAAYGVGAVNPGDILNISGSNEIVTITTDKPVPNEYYYIRTSMEADKWLYLAITVGGFAVEWFRKEFFRDMDKKDFYGKYFQEIVKQDCKTDVIFEPYLAGDRHSLELKTGAFRGLTFDTTRDDVFIGLLVGTYEPIIKTIEICKTQMKLNPNIFWTGGMVSDAYMQFKKKVFKGFDFVMTRECSTLGNGKAALKVLSK